MSKLITKSGIYTMSAADYHADPCPEPSLSASIAKVIWQKSPLHAMLKHPKLNPQKEDEKKAAFDLGSASHAAFLEGDTSGIEVIEANDWRTKAAKAARDTAYEAGMTPLLPKQFEQVEAMSAAATRYIQDTELAGIMTDGTSEQSLFAQWSGIWLRSRLDRMSGDRKIIIDYKTVGQSAKPEDYARTALFKLGHDIQAAMYLMINGLTGGPTDAGFFWLVQETEPPYACSLIGASPSILDIGESKLIRCIELWEEGIKNAHWPCYGTRIAYPDVPSWELARVEEVLQGGAS